MSYTRIRRWMMSRLDVVAKNNCMKNLHRAVALRNRLESRMKSLGLTLTIFTLTGALAALDMSGMHRVQPTSEEAVQLKPKARVERALVSSTAHAAAADEDDDEADPVVVNAFLLMPLPTPQMVGTAVAEPRYD